MFVPAVRAPRTDHQVQLMTALFDLLIKNVRVVRPMGDSLVTVLGDVPLATARQVGRSVARKP
jgi:negative regulator of sigma E activity